MYGVFSWLVQSSSRWNTIHFHRNYHRLPRVQLSVRVSEFCHPARSLIINTIWESSIVMQLQTENLLWFEIGGCLFFESKNAKERWWWKNLSSCPIIFAPKFPVCYITSRYHVTPTSKCSPWCDSLCVAVVYLHTSLHWGLLNHRPSLLYNFTGHVQTGYATSIVKYVQKSRINNSCFFSYIEYLDSRLCESYKK